MEDKVLSSLKLGLIHILDSNILSLPYLVIYGMKTLMFLNLKFTSPLNDIVMRLVEMGDLEDDHSQIV